MPNIDNIHHDHPTDQVQATFHGLNAVDPPHLIAEDEVQTATNIDFTLEYGGAACRRGSTQLLAFGSSTKQPNFLDVEFTSLTQGVVGNVDGNIYAGIGDNLIRVGTNGTSTTTIGTFSNVASTGNGWVGTAYKGFAYFVGGDGFGQGAWVKDDGTNATEWIVQVPPNAPTVTINTLTPNTIMTTLTASEGSVVSGTTVFAANATTFRLDVEQAITTNILATNTTGGTHIIGDYGIISVQAAFSDPTQITRVSMDFGIGTSFDDYYHTELDILGLADAYPDPTVLIQSQIVKPTVVQGTTTISNVAATQDDKNAMIQNVRTKDRAIVSQISAARQTLNTWLIPKTKFNTIFRNPNPGEWANVGTGRIIIEGTGTFTATLTKWQIAGAKDFSLNDVNVGYNWWQTWAQIDANTGVVLGESGPSNPLLSQKVQNVNVTLTNTDTATGGSSGVTHRIWYRQGGYLNAPYAVGTTAIATTTFLDTMADMDALSLNLPMNANVRRISELGGAARAIAPYYDRIFTILSTGASGNANTLAWTLPSQPATFPRTSYAQVGDNGDVGMALIPWLPRLIVVNERSVYEIVGNYFEGTAADFSINRTGARNGSIARITAIKTPYGVPLFNYDGLFMYIPGGGIDQPLDWVMAKIGDMWRGTAASDPAGYKGSRVPAINFSAVGKACAAFADNRYYLGVPTGTNTANDTVVVVDFRYQKVFLYRYPWQFLEMTWDPFKNKLYALTTNGNLMQIETGIADANDAGGSGLISWTFKTKSWPAPTDILMENIAIQYRGGTSSVLGIYDQTNTVTIGTLATGSKVWTIPALGGSISNDVTFQFAGSQSSNQNVIYQLDWDNWIQPKRTSYYRTDYDDNGTPLEKIFDVHFTDIQIFPNGTASGTVLATAFIDSVAISTFTLTGGSEKLRYEFAYPSETYGNIEYTIYNAVGSTVFKLYGHHMGARNEPPRTASYDSDRVSGSEQWWNQVCSDVNPLGGTVTATVYIDEVATATFSLVPGPSNTTGVGRQVFPNAFPTQEVYGKVAYVRYSGTAPFKHYRTWYITEPQPDRLTFYESSHDVLPSVGVIKTWLAELNPINGTILGTVYLDGVNIMTGTFTGSVRNIYEIGLPNITTGKTLKAVYSSSNAFKHWRTHFEMDAKPFYKNTWNVIYRKPGGATQLDLARFFQLDVETAATVPTGTTTSTITSTWYADGVAVLTNTFTLGTATRTYYDRVSFPPGIYGYLFQHQITADKPFHFWKAPLDIERIGVKGFSRTILLNGTPDEQQSVTPAIGNRGVRPGGAE